MYKIDSQKAEEFICHEEILDTLEYAQSKSHKKQRHKNDRKNKE
jgi:2-iminoacetate synthase